MKIDIDMGKLIDELPPEQHDAALAALLSCDVEQVYRFLRAHLDTSRKLALDMAWRFVSPDQKQFLNDLLTRGVEQDFEVPTRGRTEVAHGGTVSSSSARG